MKGKHYDDTDHDLYNDLLPRKRRAKKSRAPSRYTYEWMMVCGTDRYGEASGCEKLSEFDPEDIAHLLNRTCDADGQGRYLSLQVYDTNTGQVSDASAFFRDGEWALEMSHDNDKQVLKRHHTELAELIANWLPTPTTTNERLPKA